MHATPNLSIAIPTYNRARYLEANLNHLNRELRTIGEFVEVLVLDNNSTDLTESVVERAKRKGLEVNYVRRENNIGSDENIHDCFMRARGRYVLVMGDDDLLVDGALPKVLLAVGTGAGVISLNSFGYTHDPKNEKPFSLSNQTRIYTSPSKFLAKLGIGMTFISACVVNRDIYFDSPIEKKRYPYLSHVSKLIVVALSAKKNAIVNDYLIAAKRDNSPHNYDFWQTFGVTYFDILDELVTPRFGINVLRSIELKALWCYFPFHAVRDRLRGRVRAWDDPHAKIKPRAVSERWYRFIFYPILSFPRFIGIPYGVLVGLFGRLFYGDLPKIIARLKSFI